MVQEIISILALTLISCGNVLSQDISKVEGDLALENYLLHIMRNYTSWLSATNRDPIPPIPDIIKLNSSRPKDRIEVDLVIMNQYMAGQSKPLPTERITVASFLNISTFVIVRNTEGDLTFEGDYSIRKGIYRESASRNITFLGNGRFKLFASSTVEAMTVVGFCKTNAGYIDISKANQTWTYGVSWTGIAFEGLHLEGGGTMEDEKQVEKALAEVYARFLNGKNGNMEAIPPLKLLAEYMGETVGNQKLEDIVLNWVPVTTTAKSSWAASCGGKVRSLPLISVAVITSILMMSFN